MASDFVSLSLSAFVCKMGIIVSAFTSSVILEDYRRCVVKCLAPYVAHGTCSINTYYFCSPLPFASTRLSEFPKVSSFPWPLGLCEEYNFSFIFIYISLLYTELFSLPLQINTDLSCNRPSVPMYSRGSPFLPLSTPSATDSSLVFSQPLMCLFRCLNC